MSDNLDAMRTTHLKRIPKGNVIARVAQEIRRLIVGQHPPEGTKLLSEHALCAQLGISRSSVREALRVLEAVGLVETIQGKGAFGSRPCPNTTRPRPSRRRASSLRRFG